MSARLDHAKAAPASFQALLALEGHVSKSGLERTLLDLVYLRVSLINGCAFCIDMHGHDLRKRGESEQRIALVGVSDEAEAFFSARERAALAWAESVTLVATTHVPDAAFEAVKKHFDDHELAELTLAIATINAWNRLGVAFRKVVPTRTETRP